MATTYFGNAINLEVINVARVFTRKTTFIVHIDEKYTHACDVASMQAAVIVSNTTERAASSRDWSSNHLRGIRGSCHSC